MNPGQESIENIIDNFIDYAYSIAYRILGNSADAEDAVQETFIKLHRNFKKYDKGKNLKNWVCTITLNCARDIYRKRRKQPDANLDEEVHGDIRAHSENGAVNKLWIQQMLKTLSFNQRTVMIMFYIQRMPVSEIAQVLRRPEVLIKVWLHRARTSLSAKFGDQYL
ncbi:MAG: sigma-70 family RNA polymerase sigma factor [Chitinivibrionales bacterium]|nr:sigma-70 family RNA polymerase sigma factor [Chitinivibrionales bacterium]